MTPAATAGGRHDVPATGKWTGLRQLKAVLGFMCDQNFMVGRYRLRSSKTSSCNGGDDVLSVILYVTFSWTRSDPLETRKPPQCNMQPTKPSYHFSFSLPGTRIIGLLGLIVFSNAADMNTWRNAIQIQRTTGS
ncbi:hypothetical protein CK203_011805 [Vitis vinifera]|uniref:Uncharacterized protein n=1 Tax=Vitis vinifera TaxID=29760 RepID=A0A438JUF4_VITVI|nr:hypothetical protein CK203_011805 [Vitis vinifera]